MAKIFGHNGDINNSDTEVLINQTVILIQFCRDIRKKLEVAEMRMLRWMCGVTKLDKIRNERIRGTTKMVEITKKVQERRLQRDGHVMRREELYVGRRAMVMKVQGRRKRGRPKRRWLDKVKDDIKEKGLSADDVYDRVPWRRMSSYIDPT